MLAEAENEMQPSPDQCCFRALRIGHDIQQASQWERMGKVEVAKYKGLVLDYAEFMLDKYDSVKDDQQRPGLQACKLVEDMARRCMQFNETHIFVADKQMFLTRQTVLMMLPFHNYS